MPDAGDRPLDDGDYRALARFRHALRLFLRFSEEAARAEGLTPAQHQLLLAVRGWDGQEPPTVGDVAGRLQLQPHSTAELVDRAAQAGLLTASADPRDRRRLRLGLTDEGAARLAALTRLHRSELARFRAELGEVLAILPSAPADRSRPPADGRRSGVRSTGRPLQFGPGTGTDQPAEGDP